MADKPKWGVQWGKGLLTSQPTVGGLLADHLSNTAKYASGLLDPNSQVSQDAQKWHKKTQRGLEDQLAGKDTPEAKEAYQTMMNMVGVAPVGMTVWHGSPHKFSKFDMSKIGTGEGNQSYGHGLYKAELKELGEGYRDKLSPFDILVGGRKVNQSGSSVEALVASRLNKARQSGNVDAPAVKDADAIASVRQQIEDSQAAAARDGNFDLFSNLQDQKNALSRMVDNGVSFDSKGYLYKVDIPDEAVARFLDWDKKLSEQAPEVLKKVKDLERYGVTVTDADRSSRFRSADEFGDMSGAGAVDILTRKLGADGMNAFLKQQGIPGIRYLDGGSRSAGQGSSNFVLFDDQLPRILETNGIPTGQVPWKPGEWQGLLSP